MSPFPPSPAAGLDGLRAVVTGSSRGIGRAIALGLGSGGARLVVHCRSSTDEGQQVVDQVRGLGADAHLLPADLEEPRQCDELVERSWAALGGVDLWVNNAGADTLTGENARLSFEEKLALLIRTDLIATIRLSRMVGQRMQKAKGGHIINMGWDQALTGMAGDSAELFSAVKGGIMSFSKSLALSLAPGVRVNCIAPGYIRTAWGEHVSADWRQRVTDDTPLGRWGGPEDIAAMVAFLASSAAGFITGQVLCVNGGLVR